MEQIGDIIERILLDIEDKKIKKGRSFSDAGMAEICELHARLVDNLRLGMSVFLNGSVRDAQKLLEEKARFRDLERAYAGTHLTRLSENTVQSIETSSLHLDLISDLKRINSHICSIAYPILDSAGALAPSRFRQVCRNSRRRRCSGRRRLAAPCDAAQLRSSPPAPRARSTCRTPHRRPAARSASARRAWHGCSARPRFWPRLALAAGFQHVQAAAFAQEQVDDGEVPVVVLRPASACLRARSPAMPTGSTWASSCSVSIRLSRIVGLSSTM